MVSESWPSPPQALSLPAIPLNLSLPPLPLNLSFLGVPLTLSALLVPLNVFASAASDGTRASAQDGCGHEEGAAQVHRRTLTREKGFLTANRDDLIRDLVHLGQAHGPARAGRS